MDFAYHASDGWTLVNQSTGVVTLVCPDPFQCKWNGSKASIYQINIRVPASMDPDSDGYADFDGYVDRYGSPVTGCVSESVDCVRTIFQHVPVGNAAWTSRGRPGNFWDWSTEHDMSPPGEYWIQLPN